MLIKGGIDFNFKNIYCVYLGKFIVEFENILGSVYFKVLEDWLEGDGGKGVSIVFFGNC